MNLSKSPDPKYLHSLVMHGIHQPVVFHGLIKEWPASEWTPHDLASILGDKKVKIRIGLKEAKHWDSTQWEAVCAYETTTLANFCDWLNPGECGDKSADEVQHANPLLKYDSDKYWCYVDYKYMAQLFEDYPDVLKTVKWSDFGFSDRDGHQSTIWIGSQGATTPGHYDTYGCNLVAQIYGCKRWYLFPPSQSDALYQTRIPYEESSVFSPINIAKPDLNKYPQFKAATPYIVGLNPGDVLLVPRHWWHFVETLETSISVNTWIELETDHVDRYQEAITRTLVSGFLPSSGNHGNSKWLNPTEELSDTATNLQYLKKAFENLNQHRMQTTQTDAPTQQTSLRSTLSDQSSDDQLLQESASSFITTIKAGESVKTILKSTDACSSAKRRKHSSDMKLDIGETNLPDFITPVPCLGHIYKTKIHHTTCFHGDSCQLSSCYSNENESFSKERREPHTSSYFQSTNKVVPGKSTDLEVSQSKDSGAECEGRTCSTMDPNDNVLESFLQSVTHPDVVHHIAEVFCKKMKEKDLHKKANP